MDRSKVVKSIPTVSLLLSSLLLAAALTTSAQFKEIKAAPFSPAVAHRRIGALLENVDAANRDQTVQTISGWLDWYRDVLDEELIARWKTDGRTNLPLIITPLADARVALEVVDYSWRQQPQATFTLAYAPVLGDLMARYPASATPFLTDLLRPVTPEQPGPLLSDSEAQAVCRILLDMPDIGTWRKNALQILPRFRPVVDTLLKQDMSGPDQEKMYRASRWRADLRLDPPPAITSQKQSPQRSLSSRLSIGKQTSPDVASQRPHIVDQPDAPASSGFQGVRAAAPYTGPLSGTFESTGGPIAQNGEYVFPNIPPLHLLLDFDTKHWEARLEPGDGQTQVLVLHNKGKGPQKRVVVHWSVQP
jgi:hypothetical protein